MNNREIEGVAQWIWMQALTALRDDGLIATQISAPGSNTLQVLMKLAHDNMQLEKHTPWIPVAIIPALHAEVFARDFDNPDWPGDIMSFNEQRQRWEGRNGLPLQHNVTHYILLPPIGRVPAKAFV